MKPLFLKTDTHIIALSDISSIDLARLEELIVVVTTRQGVVSTATALNALELVMQTRPSAVEGRRFRAPKTAWMVHNLIAHPVMQLLALCRLYRAAFWVHDVTVPRVTRKV